jgi:phosphoglycolate phosphatase
MKYCLFDFDGTVADTSEGIIRSARFALDKMGVNCDLSDRELEVVFIGPPLTKSFPQFVGEAGVERAIELFRGRYRTKGVFENSLFDGLRECLDKLTEMNITLYIASSKPIGFIREILRQHNIGTYFTGVYAPELDEDGVTKLDVINSAVKKIREADLSPDIYMIGDRKYDILGAHEAGLKAVGVGWGSADEGELEAAGADFIAESFDDIIRICNNLK